MVIANNSSEAASHESTSNETLSNDTHAISSNDTSTKDQSGQHKQLDSLTQYIVNDDTTQSRVIPPVDKWSPSHCGKMDLVVKANGEWWHEGALIKRQRMLDLFSKVLWQENGRYYLKTPVEKIEIEVEDAPLLVNQADQIEYQGQAYLKLTTTNQDIILVDQEHPMFMREFQGEMRPYVHVRFGLNALIQRNAFYHLLQYGELIENAQGVTELRLQSGDLVLHLGT